VDTDARAAAAWRLGAPAVLMVAFALAGVLSTTGRPGVATRQEPSTTSVDPSARTSWGRPTPAASSSTAAWARDLVTDDDASAHRGAIGQGTEESDTGSVTPRVPEELRPLAPDVIVETPGQPSGETEVAHAHVPVGPADDAQLPDSTTGATTSASDDFQGPEPGAGYWFGPLGLERMNVLTEAGQ
jgi:hypothetical protein